MSFEGTIIALGVLFAFFVPIGIALLWLALRFLPSLEQNLNSRIEKDIHKDAYEIEVIKKKAKNDEINLPEVVEKHREVIAIKEKPARYLSFRQKLDDEIANIVEQKLEEKEEKESAETGK